MHELGDISVVICAYTEDRWGDLVAAVKSVRNQSLSACEVVVVVDHNHSLLMRVRADIPDVIAIENREARGLSGARNSGISISRGDIVAFVDEDAIVAADWLEQLAKHYQEPRVLGVGGAIEPMWVGERPRWFPEEFDWVVGCTYRGMPETTEAVRNLIGCNMSFRREVFAVIGGFRNGIGRIGIRPVGCEETELCIRALQRWPRGILRYEPRARVRHRVPQQRARFGYFRARCFAEGLSKALVTKYVGSRDGLATERSYVMRTLPRGIVRSIRRALLHADAAAAMQAVAIVIGLVVTGAGYLGGRLSRPIRSLNEAD